MKYFIFVLFFFFCESQDNNKNYVNFKTENYKVHSPFIPNNLDFCNEKVPIEYQDILERFDKEIIVNTYFHSKGILILKRANKYFPIIEKYLRKHNIPEDFKYLAIAESGLENVTSPAGAKGF